MTTTSTRAEPAAPPGRSRSARRHLPAVTASTIAALALLGSACGGSASKVSDAAPATTASTMRTRRTVPPEPLPEGTPIQVLDNRFYPEASIVAVGRPVVFENLGHNDHNIEPAEPGAFEPIEIDSMHPGSKATRVFDKPGTYEFYCSVHGNKDAGMVGTIIVR